MDHRTYIERIRQASARRLSNEALRQRLLGAMLTYGVGAPTIHGRCFFNAWKDEGPQDFIEISAAGETSTIQVAETVIHECAHTLAGRAAGHGREWRAMARELGLLNPRAVSSPKHLPLFSNDVMEAIVDAGAFSDGLPAFESPKHAERPTMERPESRPCPVGISTKGGVSRGVGSGSRLRLFECLCKVKARVARDEFNAICKDCNASFKRAEPQPRRTRRDTLWSDL